MVEAITAAYVQEDADWTITVSGGGKKLTARAPGIIAARDRADQLVEQLAANGKTTVVHLLNGSALDFTSAYMTARLTLPKFPPLEVPPSKAKAAAPIPGKQLPKEVDSPPAASKEKAASEAPKASAPPAARTS